VFSLDVDSLCLFVVEQIRRLVPDVVVVVTLFDLKTGSVTLRHLVGLDPDAHPGFEPLHRAEPFELFRLDPLPLDQRRRFDHAGLQPFDRGLWGLFGGKVPAHACRSVERSLDIAAIETVVLSMAGEPRGELAVLARPGLLLPPRREAVEAAAALLSLGLELLEAEDDIQSVEKSFLEFFENTSDALVLQSTDGVVVAANRTACALYGFRHDEIVGAPAERLVHTPTARTRTEVEVLKRRALGGPPQVFNAQAMTRSGRLFLVEISLARLSALGRTVLLTIIRDLSPAEEANRELNRIVQASRAIEQVIIRSTEPDQLVESTCYSLVDMIAYPEVVVVRREGSGRKISGIRARQIGQEIDLQQLSEPPDWFAGLLSERPELVSQRDGRGVVFRTAVGFEDRVFAALQTRLEDETINESAHQQLVTDVATKLGFALHKLELEQQLYQAQKMEAIGCLAGGVAHDFNNMLTVILNSSFMLAGDALRGNLDNLKQDIACIQGAAWRSQALTRELLAFSRRQVLAPVALDLNHLVNELSTMIPPLVGEWVSIRLDLEEGLPSVRADRGQLEQVVLNLVSNARDAMPRGGELTISTTRREGAVSLSVTDTGEGIDPAVRDRIFEPFFTTKGRTQGTGLGLAAVYGIVKQSGGEIEVFSAAGEGTTMRVVLPASGVRIPDPPAAAELSPATGKSGRTVLLVDDETGILDSLGRILRFHGWNVLTAEGVDAALDVSRSAESKIDVLLTDVMMPTGTGPELARRLQEQRPGLPVVYMSGHGFTVLERCGLDDGASFLQKPFDKAVLLERLERACSGG
jgi:PAS domain S-box-containing protein